MPRKTLKFVLILLSLFCGIIYILYIQNTIKKQKSEFLLTKFRDSLDMQMTINQLKNNYENSFTASQIKVNNIQLEGINGEKLFLADIMDNEKLIFKFTQKSCMPCVDHIIEVLKELGDQIGVKKIILLSAYDKTKYLEVLKNQKDIKFDCYNSFENLGVSLENDSIFQNIEFTFILDKNLKTHLPRVSSSLDSVNSTYFRRISEIFTESGIK